MRMTPGWLGVAALISVVMFIGSIGAGYIIGQGPFRHSAPEQAPIIPSPPVPLLPVPPPGPSPAPTVPPFGRDSSRSPGASAVPAAPHPPAAPAAGGTPPPATAPAPVAPQESSAPPARSPNPVGSGPTSTPEVPQLPSRFHIQIGSFAERQDADALALRVKSLGYAVAVVDGPPFRVWVGGYLDRATAEKLAQTLQTAGFEATLTP